MAADSTAAAASAYRQYFEFLHDPRKDPVASVSLDDVILIPSCLTFRWSTEAVDNSVERDPAHGEEKES